MPNRKGERPEFTSKVRERNSQGFEVSASSTPAMRENSKQKPLLSIEAVVERENMTKALLRVERNKGAAGIDEMPVEELRFYLKKHWPKIKEQLLKGCYQPQPVRRVEIPKPGGGMRKLGIPTVVDRLIQQALHQVMSPIFEKAFSKSSYGFRVSRSAHQAVQEARKWVRNGRRWVVDMDLEKFFDRVNHDILMARVARRIEDKKILFLIRAYLKVGVMENGMVEASAEGTPQGGPLSPLLSNILLDDLDKELEKRGQPFCRYADDCNIYVRSKRAGERVLGSITRFLERRLKLRVNQEKSAVARPWERKFLGYSMTNQKEARLKVSSQALRRLKGNLKAIFRAGRGRNLGRFIEEDLNLLLRGWGNYFKLSEVKVTFEDFDSWVRRKLRCILWRQWKKTPARIKRLQERGLTLERARISATNGRGAWWNSGASHMNEAFSKHYFQRLGLISLQQIQRKASCAI